MSRSIRSRLGGMMFLQYFAMGAIMPIFVLYLHEHLGFSPNQIGVISAVPALAAFVAPLVAAQIADRWCSAHVLLGLCHLASGAAMFALAGARGFAPALALYFLYSLLFSPTSALTNAVAFHHLTDARRDFGIVRVWGTIGWLAVAWVFGYWWLAGGEAGASRLPQALTVSAGTSIALGVYAFALPKGEAEGHAAAFAPWKALRLLARWDLLLLCLATFLSMGVNRFYMLWMSPYLVAIGYAEHHVMPLLSFAQFIEIFAMAGLGWCTQRYGLKPLLVTGLLLQVLRYVILYLALPLPFLMVSIATHGVSWAFYFTVGFIYVETRTPSDVRAAAQQLYGIISASFAHFAGSLLAGTAADWCTDPATDVIDYRTFWAIPLAVSIGTALLFWALFRPRESE